MAYAGIKMRVMLPSEIEKLHIAHLRRRFGNNAVNSRSWQQIEAGTRCDRCTLAYVLIAGQASTGCQGC